MSAVLAIWNDCKAGREAVYEAWYREEHLIERLNVPGFEVGRRYIALDAELRYLTSYEVANAEVLQSSEYLGRLNTPSARTRDIMQDGFENMSRTVCNRTLSTGPIRGAIVVTAAWSDGSDHSDHFDDLSAQEAVLHAELWLAAGKISDQPTAEQALRGKDKSISCCLLLEFSSERDARQPFDDLRRAAPEADVGLYQKTCELRESDLT